MVVIGMQINNNITLLNTRGFLRKVLTCKKMLYLSLAPIKLSIYTTLRWKTYFLETCHYCIPAMDLSVLENEGNKALGKQDWDGENL